MFDPKSTEQTVKLKRETATVPCFITNAAGTETFRFLIPIVETTEQWGNIFDEVLPYKRFSIIDFRGRKADQFSLNAILTTRGRARSIQPVLDRLKALMIPTAASDPSKKDEVNPSVLSLTIGDVTYQNLHLSQVQIEVKQRHNGNPTYADISLTFVSSFISVKSLR